MAGLVVHHVRQPSPNHRESAEDSPYLYPTLRPFPRSSLPAFTHVHSDNSSKGRIIFRLAEFAKGEDPSNPIPFHEAYFCIFEAVPMVFALAILSFSHPGKVLVGPESDMPQNIVIRKLRCCGRRSQNRKRVLGDNEMGTPILLEDSR